MKARATGFIALLVGLGISLTSGNVIAETKAPAGKEVATVKPEPAKRPIRMNDSQLESIVAGGHTIQWITSGSGQGTTYCVYVSPKGQVSSKPCLL